MHTVECDNNTAKCESCGVKYNIKNDVVREDENNERKVIKENSR